MAIDCPAESRCLGGAEGYLAGGIEQLGFSGAAGLLTVEQASIAIGIKLIRDSRCCDSKADRGRAGWRHGAIEQLIGGVGNHDVGAAVADGIIHGVIDDRGAGQCGDAPGGCSRTPPAPSWGGPAAIPAIGPRPGGSPAGACPAGTEVDVVDVDRAVPVAVDVGTEITIERETAIAIQDAIAILAEWPRL